MTLLIEGHVFCACTYTGCASSTLHSKKFISKLVACCVMLDWDLREWLWLECHWSTVWGNLGLRHGCILEAWRNIIARANRVGYDIFALAIRTLPRLVLLSKHRGSDQGLLGLLFLIQRLLLVNFIDIIRLGYQTVVLVVLHDHAPFINRKKDLLLRLIQAVYDAAGYIYLLQEYQIIYRTYSAC